MMKKLQFLAISSLLYVSQKLPGITFWLFLLFFGQNLKKIPVPDNFQLSIYKLKSPGASYILKVQPLPGNSMLTYSKLGIARNLLHFWKQSGTTFIFDTSFWLFPAHTLPIKDPGTISSCITFIFKVSNCNCSNICNYTTYNK